MLSTLNSFITSYFALWMVAFSLFAYFFPFHLSGLTKFITPTLGIIMFGMGMTTTPEDFKRVFKRRGDVIVGTTAQYAIMPLLGYLIARALGLEPILAAGVVLVGSCPGGTASNVITYLARGDLALSVSLTAVSTMLSPVLTPVLTYVYAGTWVDVPVGGLFLSTFEIVLVPVVAGIALRWALREKSRAAAVLMPSVSALGIIFVVGVIVAANAENIKTAGLMTALAVVLHNALGLVGGSSVARLYGMSGPARRAVAIEVGMQNSGLGVALALAHFGPLAALPGAIFSVWHNLVGSVIAWYWRRVGYAESP